MNQTVMWVAIAVAAGVGGYFLTQSMRAPGGAKGTTIDLAWDGTKCTADTKDKKLKLKKSDDDFVVWRVKGGACYDHVSAEAVIELRFGSDGEKEGGASPLDSPRPSGRKWIAAEVAAGATPGTYNYSVWLKLPDGSAQKIEDPEIEIAS